MIKDGETAAFGGSGAGNTNIKIVDGKLTIPESGNGVKFVKKVQQITFSADYARKTGQKVLCITERAVFELTDQGIMLTEIAPVWTWERISSPSWDSPR